jgi:transposase
VIGPPVAIRVFVAAGAGDLRRGFDGPAQLARDRLEQGPMTGHPFVFANRRRDRVEILCRDRDGYVIRMERLERGTFRWPTSGADRVGWGGAGLAAVLGGIDLEATGRRPRSTPAAS